MIAYIEGKLAYKSPTYVVIDVGGVGYQLRISLHTYTLLGEGEHCKLHTHLHIKEDAHVLYGFKELSERKVFLDLIGISGVGPSTALMVLSSVSVRDFHQAIIEEDTPSIQAIKGIGPKTAQRIILELKDKWKKEDLLVETKGTSLHTKNRSEALHALMTLGIAKAVAEKNVDYILKQFPDSSLEDIVKRALKLS